jgi:hypothetical protein
MIEPIDDVVAGRAAWERIRGHALTQPRRRLYPDELTSSAWLVMLVKCQKQTKKARTFDAVWRFSEHHTHPYVSGSDMKNVVWDRWPHHDETSKERAYCEVVVSKN